MLLLVFFTKVAPECIFVLLEFRISYYQEHIDFSLHLVAINALVHFEEATSVWVFFLKNNPLEIFLTYRNSQLCSEVVNIPPRKNIAYKRTRAFTLNLRNLLACKSWKQFMIRYTTRHTVLSHGFMGDTKLQGVWRSYEPLLKSTDFFALENFFQRCVGKRKTIQERSVHLLCKCRYSTT